MTEVPEQPEPAVVTFTEDTALDVRAAVATGAVVHPVKLTAGADVYKPPVDMVTAEVPVGTVAPLATVPVAVELDGGALNVTVAYVVYPEPFAVIVTFAKVVIAPPAPGDNVAVAVVPGEVEKVTGVELV